jgi:hypothetical protein
LMIPLWSSKISKLEYVSRMLGVVALTGAM